MANAQHIIEILSPYNPIAKVLWVMVDGSRRVPLFCEADGIDAAIARLHEQLEEEDRRREEEERERPKRYRKIILKAEIAKIGKLQALNSLLSGFEVAPGYSALEAWGDANEIATDYPGFSEYLAAAQTALGVDDATVATILAAAEAEG